MLSHFFPYLYGIAMILLLIQAARVMSKGFLSDQLPKGGSSFLDKINADRTGRVTIHPELLNKDGRITDEDLLTVRFSKDIDPPKSAEKPTE